MNMLRPFSELLLFRYEESTFPPEFIQDFARVYLGDSRADWGERRVCSEKSERFTTGRLC